MVSGLSRQQPQTLLNPPPPLTKPPKIQALHDPHLRKETRSQWNLPGWGMRNNVISLLSHDHAEGRKSKSNLYQLIVGKNLINTFIEAAYYNFIGVDE